MLFCCVTRSHLSMWLGLSCCCCPGLPAAFCPTGSQSLPCWLAAGCHLPHSPPQTTPKSQSRLIHFCWMLSTWSFVCLNIALYKFKPLKRCNHPKLLKTSVMICRAFEQYAAVLWSFMSIKRGFCYDWLTGVSGYGPVSMFSPSIRYLAQSKLSSCSAKEGSSQMKTIQNFHKWS